jgi:hypothetical protein
MSGKELLENITMTRAEAFRLLIGCSEEPDECNDYEEVLHD